VPDGGMSAQSTIVIRVASQPPGCKARALGFTLRVLVRTFLAWLRSALPVSFASQPLVVKRARCAYRCALF
jgi:hypothetical protein